jgi:hypothetical protein
MSRVLVSLFGNVNKQLFSSAAEFSCKLHCGDFVVEVSCGEGENIKRKFKLQNKALLWIDKQQPLKTLDHFA